MLIPHFFFYTTGGTSGRLNIDQAASGRIDDPVYIQGGTHTCSQPGQSVTIPIDRETKMLRFLPVGTMDSGQLFDCAAQSPRKSHTSARALYTPVNGILWESKSQDISKLQFFSPYCHRTSPRFTSVLNYISFIRENLVTPSRSFPLSTHSKTGAHPVFS